MPPHSHARTKRTKATKRPKHHPPHRGALAGPPGRSAACSQVLTYQPRTLLRNLREDSSEWSMDPPEQKSNLLPPSASSGPGPSSDAQALREALRSTGAFNGSRPIKVRMTTPMYTDSGAAATNTGLARIVQFTSTFFSEIASFALLYDEARVLGVKLYCQPFISISATVAPFWSFFSTSLEFDTLIAAPANLTTCMEATHHLGPLQVIPFTNGGTAGGNGNPVPFHTLKCRMPPPLAIVDTTDSPGSAWFTIDSGSNIQLFNHRAYMQGTGATGVCTFASFYEIECEFRMRT